MLIIINQLMPDWWVALILIKIQRVIRKFQSSTISLFYTHFDKVIRFSLENEMASKEIAMSQIEIMP